MPQEQVEVRLDIPQRTLRYIFEEAHISELLTASLDMTVWQEQMTRLATIQEQGVTLRFAPNEMSIPPAQVEWVASHGGVDAVPVEFISAEVADQIARTATDNRVKVTPVPPSDTRYSTNRMYYQLEPVHRIEAMGLRYSECDYVIHNSPTEGLRLSELRRAMKEYRNFRTSNKYKTWLREGYRALRTAPVTALPPVEWTQARKDAFSRFFSSVRGKLAPEDNPFDLLTELPKGTLSSRRWGIEIEAVDIEGVNTPEHWDLKSDGSLRGLEVASLPPSGRTDHDDSCDALIGEPDCTCGECFMSCDCGYEEEQNEGSSYGNMTRTGEFVSPVLRSYHSRGLRYLSEQIENRRTNNSAGVHVHVEARDLTPTQAANVSLIYSALEPLFEQEYKRNTRTYCVEVGAPEITSRFESARKLKNNGQDVSRFSNNGRYWTVNMAALGAHGTIEFRAMGPRYNYEFLTKWAHFLREIVNIAKADIPQREWTSVTTFRDLVVLFSRYGKETPTPEWAVAAVSVEEVQGKLGSASHRLPNVVRTIRGDEVFDDYSQSGTRFLGDARVR